MSHYLRRELNFAHAMLECLKYGDTVASAWMIEEAMPQQSLIVWG